MGKKKIYKCADCHVYISGNAAYEAHKRNHRRMALTKPKVLAPKRAKVYDKSSPQTEGAT